MIKLARYFIFLMIFSSASYAVQHHLQLQSAGVDLKDQASLQRGAKWFMNYCSGCHSLQYLRYNRMGQDLGISDDLVKENLIFTGAKIGDTINVSMSPDDAKSWFGIVPPDLTLITRIRNADWVYTYLKSFYREEDSPSGSNNWLYADVAMPNVLVDLQGEKIPFYKTATVRFNGDVKEMQVIDHLQLVKRGSMNQHEFDQMLHDLVNFLSYAAEPVKLERQRLGFWVLGFLLILLVLTYLLKKSYFKDIK